MEDSTGPESPSALDVERILANAAYLIKVWELQEELEELGI